MSNLNEIQSLATTCFGVTGFSPANLAKIDADLATFVGFMPPVARRPARRHTEPIQVLPEYEFVLQAVRKGCPGTLVTGRAGVGKSTLISVLTDKIQNCAVVAPTGLAAINVGGSTIHSFFGLPPRTLNPDEAVEPRRQMIPVIENLDALVIDEVSMVTPDVIDCIDRVLRKVRRDSRLFGGVPVIFVGDLLQLGPVVSNRKQAEFYTHRYRSPYFFSANVFRGVPFVPVELTKVFRQADMDFIEMLAKIRSNDNHEEAVARINQACCGRRLPDALTSLHLVPTKAAAKAINTGHLDSLRAPLEVFNAVVEGRLDAENDRFQAPHRLEIKEGSQVLFVKNNKPYWVNGTLGRIVKIDSNHLRIEITATGNTVTVERETWEKLRYDYDPINRRIVTSVVGTFKQFPVTLGWAITIHKSQGMTLDSVRIDLGRGAFCHGQTYVALSRCRSLEGISLDRPIAMRDVKADEAILEFYRRLNPLRAQ